MNVALVSYTKVLIIQYASSITSQPCIGNGAQLVRTEVNLLCCYGAVTRYTKEQPPRPMEEHVGQLEYSLQGTEDTLDNMHMSCSYVSPCDGR